MDRNLNIIVGLNGEKIVLINDIRFKGKTDLSPPRRPTKIFQGIVTFP